MIIALSIIIALGITCLIIIVISVCGSMLGWGCRETEQSRKEDEAYFIAGKARNGRDK